MQKTLRLCLAAILLLAMSSSSVVEATNTQLRGSPAMFQRKDTTSTHTRHLQDEKDDDESLWEQAIDWAKDFFGLDGDNDEVGFIVESSTISPSVIGSMDGSMEATADSSMDMTVAPTEE